MIAAEQRWVEDRMGGRSLEPRDFALFLSGDGGDSLPLGQGPVQTFTSLEYVSYGNAQPALEVIDPATFMIVGGASDGRLLPAHLRCLDGSRWFEGARNYKATFNSGWPFTPPLEEGGTIGPWTGPASIKQLVTDLVVWRRNRKSDVGLRARDIGVPGGMSFESDSDMLVYVNQVIGPYCDPFALPGIVS